MPPKKDAPPSNACIEGYDSKETKLLAAAFVSSIGPDKVCIPPASIALTADGVADSSRITLTSHSTTTLSSLSSLVSPKAR